MAARGAGASNSARSVSAYRSRSNVRPSASVPENAIAIHRIPAAASGGAWPSLTNANEKTSTHDTAKNSVVTRISSVLTSIAKSFLRTSKAVRTNISSRAADGAAVARPQAGRRPFVGDQASLADERYARDEAIG